MIQLQARHTPKDLRVSDWDIKPRQLIRPPHNSSRLYIIPIPLNAVFDMSHATAGFGTRAIHVGAEPNAETGAVIAPISLSTTYKQDGVGKHKGFEYSRSGNPNRDQLERLLASIEVGGGDAVAFASGSATTATVLQALGPNAHVVSVNDVYGAHGRNALKVAAYLQSISGPESAVESVTYPGLASHPRHELAIGQLSPHAKKFISTLSSKETAVGVPFSGMISFRIKGGLDTAEAFLVNSEYFTLAESLGGVESLGEVPASMTHGSIPEAERAALGITSNLIRLSVGVEDADDLVADIHQALQAAVPGVIVPEPVTIETPESSRSVNDTPEGSIPATPADALPAQPLSKPLKLEQLQISS
ncbi:hypothetical protein RSAG8_10651, partial [Rhizoctonia solani AG-8 WAC10335]